MFHIEGRIVHCSQILLQICSTTSHYTWDLVRHNVLYRNKVPTTGASVTWQNIFLDLRKFPGSWKDSWIVNFLRFSLKLSVDLCTKPGFKIVFSIWQTFQKRFVQVISILNIFSDLQNIFRLSLLGFRSIRTFRGKSLKLCFMSWKQE